VKNILIKRCLEYFSQTILKVVSLTDRLAKCSRVCF